MNRPLNRLVRRINEWRGRPKSRGRTLVGRAAKLLAAAYVALLLNPSPLFAHSYHAAPFSVYSDRPIPDDMAAVLDAAAARLAASPMVFESEQFHVYIANDAWRRRLVSPVAHGAFGAYYPLTGNVVLNRADVEDDLCFIGDGEATRPLHAIVAHECTHEAVARRLGLWHYLRIPTWVQEGYAETVSGGPSVDPQDAADAIADGRSDQTFGFRYATYRLAVEQLLGHEGVTPSRLFSRPHDFEAALARAVERRTAGR